jgi:hypothetical protein
MVKKKKVTKLTLKGYWKPTPLKMRKIGDALLGAFSILSTASIVGDNKSLAITSLIIGVVGKVISNFFSEESV